MSPADIVIVGGGPVGAALALALANAGIEPVLLESREAGASSADPRPLAVAYGSRLILERLGVWEALGGVTPIERIHVSQRGGFGRLVMTAAEAGLPALGYVVEYAHLHSALRQAVRRRVRGSASGVTVTAVAPGAEAAAVQFMRDGRADEISARMAVIADGGAVQDNAARRLIDYRQTAVVAVVKSELPHRSVAFERFTAEGPLALLPYGTDLALVWTMGTEAARRSLEQPADAFLVCLREHFGGRLGAFRAVGARMHFPLRLAVDRAPVDSRTVRIGNAAQTLHPVAGQGFNLGLRDAWELTEQIVRADHAVLGSASMLGAYERRRRIDRSGGIGFTDALVQIFSNDLAPLRMVRGLGLAALGALPAVKNFVIRRMTFGARG